MIGILIGIKCDKLFGQNTSSKALYSSSKIWTLEHLVTQLGIKNGLFDIELRLFVKNILAIKNILSRLKIH